MTTSGCSIWCGVASTRSAHGGGLRRPLVLARAGLVKGRAVTSHPSVQAELAEVGADVTARRVVRDGVLLTSQGPGTAMEFALAVAAELVGQEAADEVAAAMCC